VVESNLDVDVDMGQDRRTRRDTFMALGLWLVGGYMACHDPLSVACGSSALLSLSLNLQLTLWLEVPFTSAHTSARGREIPPVNRRDFRGFLAAVHLVTMTMLRRIVSIGLLVVLHLLTC